METRKGSFLSGDGITSWIFSAFIELWQMGFNFRQAPGKLFVFSEYFFFWGGGGGASQKLYIS